MEHRRYLYNPLFEDETIHSFSETPGVAETKEDVEEAEEETEEIQDQKEEENKPEPTEEEQEQESSEGDLNLGEDDTEGESSEEDKEPEDQPASDKEAKDNDLDEGATKSDAELCMMTEHQIDCIRFFKSRMEYGTPEGSDDPSGCPGCADAADAAIIDAEVAPSEGAGTKRDQGNEEGGGDSFGGDVGGGEEGEDDFTEDFEMYIRLRKDYRQGLRRHRALMQSSISYATDEIPGMEEWGEKLMKVMGFIGKKLVKYTRRTYIFCRNKISKIFFRAQTINKLWKFKLSRGLNKVDMDRLSNYEVEAFPYDTWLHAAKISLMCFDTVKNAEHIITAPDRDPITPDMQRFADDLDNIGISLDLTKNKVNSNNLMDKRQHASVTDLGFTKQQIPNVVRYFGEIAKRVPRGDLNNLEKICDKARENINKFAVNINHQVETGRVRKNSEEYQELTDQLLARTVRYDFVLTSMFVAYFLFDKLSVDSQRVFSKFEDAMSFSIFVD